MTEAPDRVYVEDKDRELYDRLVEEDIFKPLSRKQQFIVAMAYGFRNKSKRVLGTPRDGFFLTKDLKPDDEALLAAIALADQGSADVLADRKKVFEIAEEYAHAGIVILHSKLEGAQYGSFAKRLEKELMDDCALLFGSEAVEK